MYAIIVKYKNGDMAFYPSCKSAALEWGCSNQAVLNMMRNCANRPSRPLANSSIANRLGIERIVDVKNIEDLNKFEKGPFMWINGDN